ncbi:MAG: hypothetical protein K2Q18_18215 [Bdellovibrionales bacterium]|nr:hypothetical protein [Bdellovibrionales bacterium]
MRNIAEFNSLQSFLTAYLIGHKNYEILTDENLPGILGSSKHVLNIANSFYIPLIFKSQTGLHTFKNALFEKKNDHYKQISFSLFVHKICDTEKVSQENVKIFKLRVLKSLKTIEAILKDKKFLLEQISKLQDFSFQSTEQSLVFGHFSHPYPKLQESELKNNQAHLEKTLNLKWCLVHKSLLHLEFSKHFTNSQVKSIVEDLFRVDQGRDLPLKEDYTLFPFHPTQHEYILEDKIIKKYFKENLIINIENKNTKMLWIPTTSLRTIYNEISPWMLKFSLPVRLTNSIRTLQDNEVKRGIQLHEVFHSKKGLKLQTESDISALKIIHEPLFLALKDEENRVMKNTIVVFRENPFLKNESNTIALASLNQISSYKESPLLALLIEKISERDQLTYEETALKWFDFYLEKVIFPFVILQGRHGIYLGAHQQNVIIQLGEDLYPKASFYRDCQGTGYSELGFMNFKNEAESLNTPNGNVLSTNFANSLIGYYLFINSTLFTIKTLANKSSTIEDKFIKIFQKKLKSLPDIKDSSFINYVLNSKSFLIKDNFECCLNNINENTIDNPLKFYKEFKNPFFAGEL